MSLCDSNDVVRRISRDLMRSAHSNAKRIQLANFLCAWIIHGWFCLLWFDLFGLNLGSKKKRDIIALFFCGCIRSKAYNFLNGSSTTNIRCSCKRSKKHTENICRKSQIVAQCIKTNWMQEKKGKANKTQCCWFCATGFFVHAKHSVTCASARHFVAHSHMWIRGTLLCACKAQRFCQ